jgi:hypothetical protein
MDLMHVGRMRSAQTAIHALRQESWCAKGGATKALARRTLARRTHAVTDRVEGAEGVPVSLRQALLGHSTVGGRVAAWDPVLAPESATASAATVVDPVQPHIRSTCTEHLVSMPAATAG